MSSHRHAAFCCTAGNCALRISAPEAGFRNFQAGVGSWDSWCSGTDLLGLPQTWGSTAVLSKEDTRTEQELRVYLILEGIFFFF